MNGTRGDNRGGRVGDKEKTDKTEASLPPSYRSIPLQWGRKSPELSRSFTQQQQLDRQKRSRSRGRRRTRRRSAARPAGAARSTHGSIGLNQNMTLRYRLGLTPEDLSAPVSLPLCSRLTSCPPLPAGPSGAAVIHLIAHAQLVSVCLDGDKDAGAVPEIAFEWTRSDGAVSFAFTLCLLLYISLICLLCFWWYTTLRCKEFIHLLFIMKLQGSNTYMYDQRLIGTSCLYLLIHLEIFLQIFSIKVSPTHSIYGET